MAGNELAQMRISEQARSENRVHDARVIEQAFSDAAGIDVAQSRVVSGAEKCKWCYQGAGAHSRNHRKFGTRPRRSPAIQHARTVCAIGATPRQCKIAERTRSRAHICLEKRRCRLVRISAQFAKIQHRRGCRIGCAVRCARQRTAAGKHKHDSQNDEWPYRQPAKRTQNNPLTLLNNATSLCKAAMARWQLAAWPRSSVLKWTQSLLRHANAMCSQAIAQRTKRKSCSCYIGR